MFQRLQQGPGVFKANHQAPESFCIEHALRCIHPNYLGDLFTYTGWALACGTTCALSIPIFMLPNGFHPFFLCFFDYFFGVREFGGGGGGGGGGFPENQLAQDVFCILLKLCCLLLGRFGFSVL